jgi:glutathione synthase/RimK-type ligase-like ATP-grasp enzyme
MSELVHIGNVELLSLVDDQVDGIPAKIDTGADGSSIWASNVKLAGGKLSFNFFAPGSAYYREEPIVTTAFKATSVKNSFGHEEFRYKIRLRVKVGDHTLTRWFSLADRSRNTYPILLGKNFLSKRFVVDVSQKYLVSKGPNKQSILVLGAQKSRDFFKNVKEYTTLDVDYECINYAPIVFYIDGLATKVINSANSGKDLADYTLTYFKTHNRNMEFATAIATYLQFKAKPFLDRELTNIASQSKLTEYMKLACHGLPLPTSICAQTDILITKFDEIIEKLGTPFVLKEIASNQGRNNFLINKQSDFKRILKAAAPDQVFLAQKYINNDGFLRIYVLGKEVGLAVKRTPAKHKDPLKVHLNKPNGGANATQIDAAKLPVEIRELVIRAANALERQIAGVDLLQDNRSGTWYILEVNNAPQLRTGSNIETKAQMIAKFFDKELKR